MPFYSIVLTYTVPTYTQATALGQRRAAVELLLPTILRLIEAPAPAEPHPAPSAALPQYAAILGLERLAPYLGPVSVRP